MSEEDLKRQLAEAQETIRMLQEELAETNREVVALTLDLEERMDDLRALNAMGTIVNEARGVEELLKRSIDESLQVVGVRAAAILLVDEESETLPLVAHRGLGEPSLKEVSRSDLGKGITGCVAQTGEPKVIDHVEKYPGDLRMFLERERIQSIASIPLTGSPGVVGVMNLAATEPHHFDERTVGLLVALGRQIATGIEKARLHEETIRWATELEERVEERTVDLGTANRQLEQEIAERKQVEAALRESERRYAIIAKNLPNGLVQVINRDLQYVFNAGEQLEKMGLSNEALVGKSIHDVLPEESVDLAASKCRQAFEGESVSFEGDYAGHTFLVNAVPMDSDNGKIDEILVLSIDITRRKQAEEELQEYSEHLEEMVEERTRELQGTQQRISEALELNRKIIDASTVGITAYDESGDCILANESAARIVGATREQVLDQNFRHIGSWQESSLLQAAETAIDEEKRTRKEVHIVSTFGRDAWLDCRFVPFTLSGEPHLLLVIDDVTERKRLQEQLIRQEKLATLGRLSGSVSHELRNPLGAIRNAAYFLGLVVDDPDPDVQEALEILEREVDRSEAVIKAMLDFARSEPPTRREVDLNDILERTLERLEIPSEVEVAVRLDDRICGIQGDPDQLGEVFFNIARNAVDAMPDGGQVIVESEAASDQEVTVSISDTGSGIPEHLQEQIFEPLFTTKTQGIGLGLAIVKTLVEGHGGAVEVESPAAGLGPDGEHEGTTFTVRLPVGDGIEGDEG